MSKEYSKYQIAQKAVHKSVKKLVSEDGFSYDQLADFSGYDGVNSVRNAVKNNAYKIDGIRFILLLLELSERENLRLHNHILNPRHYQILPRYGIDKAEGSITDIIKEINIRMYEADTAIEVGNSEVVHQFYQYLLKVAARIQVEAAFMDMKLKGVSA